ncbi:hypothetical protein AB0H00_17025 [Nocardia sp. NPDC023852]|uniref:hypothetical protein n=1 Tax=Nocardia sp. NPDC023852 TaxID=3154697 RepID=UPI0033DA17D1
MGLLDAYINSEREVSQVRRKILVMSASLLPIRSLAAFPDRSRVRTALIGVVAVASAVLLIGCSSDSGTSVKTMPSSPLATAESAKCIIMEAKDYQNPDEKQFTAVMAKLQLPAGTCFFAVDTVDLPDRSGKVSVYVDLNVRDSTSPDDLRAAATDIAHALKGTEVAQRAAELSVTNWGSNHPPYRAFLSDKNFQNHPWDGTPSRQSELAIWEIDPCAGCTR